RRRTPAVALKPASNRLRLLHPVAEARCTPLSASGVYLLLRLRRLDHPLRDLRRHLLVAVEGALVMGPAMGQRTERGGVTVELGQRNERADPRLLPLRVHTQDPAAPLVQVADHLPHVLI